MAGKRGRCPACKEAQPIPTPEPEPEPEPAPPPVASGFVAARTGFVPTAYPSPTPPSTATKLDARCHCGQIMRIDPDEARAHSCPGCNAPVVHGSYRIYETTIQYVHLIDARMPFGSMCWLVFKWTFASIPTILVLGALWLVALAFITAANK